MEPKSERFMRSLGAAQDWWEAGAYPMRARGCGPTAARAFVSEARYPGPTFAQVDGRSESDAEAGCAGAQDQAECSMRSWAEEQANRVERSG